MVYKWYILLIGWLYTTYHPLQEPGKSIEKRPYIFPWGNLSIGEGWAPQIPMKQLTCFFKKKTGCRDDQKHTVHHHSPEISDQILEALCFFPSKTSKPPKKSKSTKRRPPFSSDRKLPAATPGSSNSRRIWVKFVQIRWTSRGGHLFPHVFSGVNCTGNLKGQPTPPRKSPPGLIKGLWSPSLGEGTLRFPWNLRPLKPKFLGFLMNPTPQHHELPAVVIQFDLRIFFKRVGEKPPPGQAWPKSTIHPKNLSPHIQSDPSSTVFFLLSFLGLLFGNQHLWNCFPNFQPKPTKQQSSSAPPHPTPNKHTTFPAPKRLILENKLGRLKPA